MHRGLNKYESTDSVVFLDPHGRRSTSTSYSPTQSPLHSPTPTPKSLFVRDEKADPTKPLKIELSIRFGRLVLLTVIAVGGILGLMFVFNHGVEVKRFESSQYDKAAQQRLLDNYNSYSGNISSAFGKPIEILVPLLVQIFMLRFMAQAFTQPETTFKQQALVLALSAGIGYLITNGFNAVNVQLRPQDVQPVIFASDLTVGSDLNETVAAATTTVTKTISELTPGNLISNTVLRNAVLPRVTLKQDICDWRLTQGERNIGAIPMPTVDYGFTQREWQKRLLQRALEPKTLRVVVNPTDANINKDIKATSLPMNASTAADLLVYALAVGPVLFPWGSQENFLDQTKIEEESSKTLSVARRIGLLPPTSDTDELTAREWFLKELPGAVTHQFNDSENTSRANIGVEFSRVAITSDITFEAVTFEVDLDPKLLSQTSSSSSNRRIEVFQAAAAGAKQDCGPWPALCFVARRYYQGRQKSAFEIEPLQQVQAFGSCMNKNRTEELWTFSPTTNSIDCSNISDSSFMIMSVGKRLVATSFEQNKSVTSEPATAFAVLTNLRKVYTFTIGRLSWQLQNLSSTFNAECGADATKNLCVGLHVPLLTSSLSHNGLVSGGEVSNQRLIVSVDALPTSLLMPTNLLTYYKPRAIPLVEVSESPYEFSLAGDVLLPHNAGKITWANTTLNGTSCDADYEAHLFTRINNHLYIEHSFQVAYTAATFFLLQNGAVKDTIALSDSQNVTLNFDKNVQDVVVWVSTPFQNAMLSVAGCALLVLCLILTTIKSMAGSTQAVDPLAAISTPQAIARVMLDDKQFPSLLLHRRVVDEGESPQPLKIDQFAIAGVTLEHNGKHQRLTAIQ